MVDNAVLEKLMGLIPDLQNDEQENKLLDSIANLAEKPSAVSITQMNYSPKELSEFEKTQFITDLAKAILALG